MSLPAAGAQTHATASVARAAAAPLEPQAGADDGRDRDQGGDGALATFPASTASGHLLVIAASVFTGEDRTGSPRITDSAGHSRLVHRHLRSPPVTTPTASCWSSRKRPCSHLSHGTHQVLLGHGDQRARVSGVTRPARSTPRQLARPHPAPSRRPRPGRTATGADLAVGFIAGRARAARPSRVTAPRYAARRSGQVRRGSMPVSVITRVPGARRAREPDVHGRPTLLRQPLGGRGGAVQDRAGGERVLGQCTGVRRDHRRRDHRAQREHRRHRSRSRRDGSVRRRAACRCLRLVQPRDRQRRTELDAQLSSALSSKLRGRDDDPHDPAKPAPGPATRRPSPSPSPTRRTSSRYVHRRPAT